MTTKTDLEAEVINGLYTISIGTRDGKQDRATGVLVLLNGIEQGWLDLHESGTFLPRPARISSPDLCRRVASSAVMLPAIGLPVLTSRSIVAAYP